MNISHHFLESFEEINPIFAKEIRRTYEADQALFTELADPMLSWAEAVLGDNYISTLIAGYCEFVMDVNRSQIRYEGTERYQYSTYDEVFKTTYGNAEFMNLYHWGVFTTTFGWQHHLELYSFYRDHFLDQLISNAPDGRIQLLDLGCGSGVWHFLAHRFLPAIETTAVDISERSIELTKEMAAKIFTDKTINYELSDALEWQNEIEFDAGISCFLLEHLEKPFDLLVNLSNQIKPGGMAFVTCALTAAEIDHIYEFKRESEVILMAEESGFRVINVFSASPLSIQPDRKYLPRSMGMILQKRRNDIW